MIRVLLADDHLLVRHGLRALLAREGFDVVAEASDGLEAVHLASELRPDVAVLDVGMPLLNGIDAAREIARVSPPTRAVVLTMHAEGPFVLEAVRVGVRGYVLKTQAALDVVRAVREVAAGSVYLSPGVSASVTAAYAEAREMPHDVLTRRERHVLQLVAEGKTTKEAAMLLGTTVKTAASHRTRAMKKLGIHETATLVRYAIRHGLVYP